MTTLASSQTVLNIEGESGIVRHKFEKFTVGSLLGLVAQHVDAGFSYQSESMADAEIGLIGEQNIAAEDLLVWARSTLFVLDMTLTELGSAKTRIYHLARRSDRALVPERAKVIRPDQIEAHRFEEGRLLAVTFPLQFLSPGEARRALSAFRRERPSMQIEGPDSSSILVIDFAPALWHVHQLLRSLDRASSQGERHIGTLSLLHHDASALGDILGELFAPAENSSASRPPPRVVGDARTNSIVVIGSQAEVQVILETVAILDLGARHPDNRLRVYLIEYGNAVSLAEELTVAFGGSISGRSSRRSADREAPPSGRQEDERDSRGRSDRPGTSVVPGRMENPGEDLPRIVTVADRNALIVSATDRQHDNIKALLLKLDQPLVPIHVDVFVTEINRDDIDSFGVELAKVDTTGSLGYLLTTAFGLSSTTTTSANGSIQRMPILSGNGLLAGIVASSVGVPLLLRALEETTKSKLLTSFSALCNEEQTATIASGQQVATVETLRQVRRDGEPGMGFTPIGGDDISEVDRFRGYEDATISLEVTPGRYTGEHLTIALNLTLQNFSGPQVDLRAPPARTQKSFGTEVTLVPDQLLFIGELHSRALNETVSGIPFLSDLPLIGNFMKRRDHASNDRMIAIFLKARPLLLEPALKESVPDGFIEPPRGESSETAGATSSRVGFGELQGSARENR